MYLEHYGLSYHPFQITPDVNFFFDSRVHKRALATITYGLSKQEGFVVVTGDVGAGKTTLIEYLLARGDLKKVVVARIITTQLEADNLLELISSELELRKSGATKAAMLRDLKSFFLRIAQAGKYVLLIVDEVQNLSAGALEELRMLSNFQDRERPLVQQLLVGQPEFRARLGSPECEQIRQRVIASYHLLPLTAEEVPVYIDHRLHQAGYRGDAVFTSQACRRIHDETGGVPRKINRLCDRLLLYGFLEEADRIDGAAVESVTAEMRLENLIGPGPQKDTPVNVETKKERTAAEPVPKPEPVTEPGPKSEPEPEPEPEPGPVQEWTKGDEYAAGEAPRSLEDETILELGDTHKVVDHVLPSLVEDVPIVATAEVDAHLRYEHEALLKTVRQLQSELHAHKHRIKRLQTKVLEGSVTPGKKA